MSATRRDPSTELGGGQADRERLHGSGGTRAEPNRRVEFVLMEMEEEVHQRRGTGRAKAGREEAEEEREKQSSGK